jgi:drug/metabolite transporter (DMT)-like permease
VPITAAYLGVILIWSTTPLAIQWSGEVGFLFGVAARMLIGVQLCLLLLALFGQRMSWEASAVKTYLVAGFGLWGAMTLVYWGAQQVNSGLVSVVFGLTPLVTGLLAACWLNERAFGWHRLLGMVCGFLGMAVLFRFALTLSLQALWALAALFIAVCIHSLSAVWVKRIASPLHPLQTTTGSLLVATPLFLLAWGLADGQLPTALPLRAASAIVYLGVFGSALGFVLYFYILGQIEASRVAMITLITPMMALWLGQVFNGERIGWTEWLGTLLILLGLSIYQWGHCLTIHHRLMRWRRGQAWR